jgi:hypothetical protein
MRSSLPFLLALFLRGIAASEDAVDADGNAQASLAADPWAERQADLDRKWGFEVRHSLFSSPAFPSP